MLYRERALWRHAVVGFGTAALAGGADIVSASLREGQRVPPADFAFAALYLLAMVLPLGAVGGMLLGGALDIASASPWIAPLRRLFRRRFGFARHPRGFADVMGALASLAVFALLLRRAAEHFATRYHDAGLAAWALALSAFALLAAALFVGGLLRPLFLGLGRGIGVFASPSMALMLALGSGAGLAAYLLIRSPTLLSAYSPWLFGILGGAALVYLLGALAARRDAARGARRRGWALGALALSLAALVAAGSSYGRSNRVRSVVEQRSTLGRTLLRRYAALTDRDGDGHSFAFGGQDCDDTRADVYPGAPDEAGDGVDADCFDGDGGREVADLARGAFGQRPAGLPERPNILLITVDALRWDHLGCSGYERDTSPHMDRFCAQSVRFENTYAPSSRSLRSIPAMMTGLYPSQVEFGPEFLWPSLKPSNDTLAEVLVGRGYQSAVVMGTNYFVRVDDFFQGFQRIQQAPIYVPPRSRAVDDALRQLDRLREEGRPWLLWVHLFNVHQPYLQDDVPSQFGPEPMDAYDTEIRLADREVQRLLAAVDAQPLRDSTVVAIASDHGEAFGEHGKYGHSTTLYEEEIRAALMIRVPGVEPRAVSERVSLIDLMPTLLNLTKDTPVPRPIPGRSLLPLMTGEDTMPEDRLLFSELMPDGLFAFDVKAVLSDNEKLVYWVRDGTYQLFDLAADPGEMHDISDTQRERADELLGLLRAWTAQTSRPENSTRRFLEQHRLRHFPSDLTPLDARYPDRFRIAGYKINKRSFRPGERIHVDLYYEVEGETEDDLFFYLDLRPPPATRLPPHFHGHHFPLEGRYKTFQWRSGERLRDPVEIVIPRQIATPMTLRLQLTVLRDHRPVSFVREGGQTGHTLDLGEIELTR